ncbi:MAG: COX15/CtaA family protein [Actinomycetota bacterium]|nr:COX15/CtaA family protein [Actinomycetota bacterium]
MTRLQRLATSTLGVTILLVALGGFTRGSGSGYGCADRWPLCENGLLGGLLPRPEFPMVVEWTHRWFASIAVLLVVATTVYVWVRHRTERGLRWGVTAALVTILTQAGLGAVVVKTNLATDLVSVHLGVAMVLLALLSFVVVESFFAAGDEPIRSAAPDRGWRRTLSAGLLATFAVIALGSLVHNEYVGGWPLVGGELIPDLSRRLVALHFGHRVAVVLTVVLLALLTALGQSRGRPVAEVRLVRSGFVLFVLNIAIGAAHVFTQVRSAGLVVGHLLVASLVWCALAGAGAIARRADRAGLPDARPQPEPMRAGT